MVSKESQIDKPSRNIGAAYDRRDSGPPGKSMSFEFLKRAGKEYLTCAVFGGKNSKEKDGFPVRADSASLSLMCIMKISN